VAKVLAYLVWAELTSASLLTAFYTARGVSDPSPAARTDAPTMPRRVCQHHLPLTHPGRFLHFPGPVRMPWASQV